MPGSQSDWRLRPTGARGLKRFLAPVEDRLFDLAGWESRLVPTFVFCLVSAVMCFSLSLLNLFEHQYFLVEILLCVTAIACVSIGWLFFTKKPFFPLILTAGTLMCLGWILIYTGGVMRASIFYFFWFPPMLMFTMGPRLGSYAFLFFYLTMLVLFSDPVQPYLQSSYDPYLRLRYLIVLFASYLFTWLMELALNSTQRELRRTAMRLEHYALTDHLTGLGNRRALQMHFDRENAKFLRSGKQFCLLLGDLDNFKCINDTYGHKAGDAVLRHVAKVMKDALKPHYSLFRWGGEEFLALMPDTNLPEALEIAEKLRLAVQDTACRHKDLLLPITISFGLKMVTDDQNLEDHVNTADIRLYAAKARGKNCVCCQSA